MNARASAGRGGYSENDLELLTVDILGELGWKPADGDKIAPGTGERESWDELHIRPRLLDAMLRLNPDVPTEYVKQALAELLTPSSADAITENFRLHRALTEGARITYYDEAGVEHTPSLRIVSRRPEENDWIVARQVTIRNREHQRRFDVVLYLNGMPVVVVELKRPGTKAATAAAAYNQLCTYLQEFPLTFRFCLLTIASDGYDALYGTPFTPLNHFSPWNVDDDGRPLEANRTEDGETVLALEDLLNGVGNQERFLQLLRNFTAFDENAAGLTKRIAKPHQYFAVAKAVAATIDASTTNGKAGVVWHTQGSGKSMEMELYTHLVMARPELQNPTVIVVTDRNELDGQLFEGFNQSRLLDESPVQVGSREQLRRELTERRTGGILFTTLQKFSISKDEKDAGLKHPLLTDRRNVIVVVDEAHRSHYDDIDGYAAHLRDALPHATLIAFTGTPISFDERDTRDTFGDYIDIYDLTRSVDDGATVPVAFEPRLIKVTRAEELTEEDLNRAADEATVGIDDTERARLESSVAVVNAVYGAPERIEELARDIVEHWENRRAQMESFIGGPGKALIVGATRQICADLYSAIVSIRPDWHSEALDGGVIKVVYSGSASDPAPIQNHVRRESQNKAIKARLKDGADKLELVIVKDMMLTGFDAPALHTLYLDRPLKGALLMQTLARVNRTYKQKKDGLLVAYAPLVDNLQAALSEYTVDDRNTKPVGRNTEEAAEVALKFLSQLRSLLSGFTWRETLERGGPKAWLNAVSGSASYLRRPENNPAPRVVEFVATDAAGTDSASAGDEAEGLASRFRTAASGLARSWALASGLTTLAEVRDEVRFFEDVRVTMAKFDASARQASGEPIPEDVQLLLSSLIASATAAGGVVDIYDAAGIDKPRLQDLTPEFAAKAQESRNPHLALEALRDLLVGETKVVTRGNVARERAFAERIAELMLKYTNQQLTAAEVIAELVALAGDVSREASRGESFTPPLNNDELSFYDAVATNEVAVDVQGTDVLAQIARELVAVMRRDVRTDWTVRDDVRAKLRSSIKRLLMKYKYPPDKQPEAIGLVMEQMEAMAPRFADERAEGAA